MTTSIKVTSTQDLFVENEVFNLNAASWPNNYMLAGASWVASESSPYDSLLHVLKNLFVQMKCNLSDCNLWLLVGTTAWQPNTRIVRYKGLWGALRARGLAVPSYHQRPEEVIIESENGLKFFGAAKLHDFEIEDAVRILLTEHCTYLAMLASDIPVHSLLSQGWSGDMRNDSKFIGFVAGSSSLLLKQIGEFDDIERGIVAIGCPAVVNALLGI